MVHFPISCKLPISIYLPICVLGQHPSTSSPHTQNAALHVTLHELVDCAVQCAILLITLTPALAAFKQKLFYHIQVKGSAMFEKFLLFTHVQPLL